MSMRFGRGRANLDQDAERIIVAIYPDLRKFAAVVADLDVDPDDLVQEALVSVLKSAQLPHVDNPLAYMKRAVVNRAMSNRRTAARRRDRLPKLVSPSVYNDQYPSDLAALAALSAQDRAIVYLAELDGYKHEEIAKMLNLNVPTVSQRLSRARRKLREELTNDREVVGHTMEVGL